MQKLSDILAKITDIIKKKLSFRWM